MTGLAAGLLQASCPSPYKPGMTALSGLGSAVQSGLAARRQAQEDALKQTMVRSKTIEGGVPLLKLERDAAEGRRCGKTGEALLPVAAPTAAAQAQRVSAVALSAAARAVAS
jgi:hypothetical protein